MSTVVAAPRDLGLETVPFPKAHVTGAQQNSSNGSTYKHSDEDERIIDIRRGAIEHSVLEDMMSRLQPGEGKAKQMPTLLLYDELGLKLFEDITYLDEYYLTNAEIDILQRHAADIASRLQPDSMIIELGSGNLRKVNILLAALERSKKRIDYYALDLSLPELIRTLSAVPPGTFNYVRCRGLHGTYDDGLAWLKLPQQQSKPKCILSLGSSIGNFEREAAPAFLANFSNILQLEDSILVGLDACQDADKVYHAYNDRLGVTHDFVRNGLTNANRILGEDVFDTSQWKVIGEYDAEAGRHQAFYEPSRDVVVRGITIHAGERVRVEESYKYSAVQSAKLWEGAGLVEGARFGTLDDQYNLHHLTRLRFPGSLDRPESYAASPVPSMEDWKTLWASWDAVTLGMVEEKDLLSQPIKLRNALVFYVGHIPTFLDIHLTRATNEAPTEPSHYALIFERGIDPDVDNPEHCHSHSEIPESWPPVKEIRQFQSRVRERVESLYASGAASSNMRIGRALWLALEHEIMHLETLLYMLLQSDKTLPPPGTVRPSFEGLARTASKTAVPNQWISIPDSTLEVGLDDPDANEGPSRYFGWDNEKPSRMSRVPAFVAKARPITNQEYLQYLEAEGASGIPASWEKVQKSNDAALVSRTRDSPISNGVPTMKGSTNGNGYRHPNGHVMADDIAIRTVYGPIPLKHALYWPVLASFDEMAGCARWMGGRIPTADELRSIYSYADSVKTVEANQVLANRISAVNGHLSNNGVQETPPYHHCGNGASGTKEHPDPRPLHVNLEGCNVGFRHWHPTSISDRGNKLCGQGEAGGAWEWTSSVLEKHEGFKPMDLYPAYTADFFDGKHNIMLGGSWATHPRIAGRKTFVNWYQRNYPYVWATARIVKDL